MKEQTYKLEELKIKKLKSSDLKSIEKQKEKQDYIEFFQSHLFDYQKIYLHKMSK